MKTSTKVWLILAGVCLGIGIICFCISLAMGGFRGKNFWNAWNAWTENRNFWNVQIGPIDWGDSVEFQAQADEVNRLELDIGLGEVSIEEYEGDAYEISYPEKFVTCSRQDGVLSVQSTKKRFQFFSFHFGDWGSPTVKIRIPKGSVLKEASISTGASETEIERLEADIIYLETGAGELRVSHLKSGKKLTLEAGVGEMKVEDMQVKDVSLTVGVGQLEVSGRASGDIAADCGVGEITMDLDNWESDFNYDVSCGVGEVNMNGESFSGLGRSHEKDHGTKQDFDISCGVGKISIKLKED